MNDCLLKAILATFTAIALSGTIQAAPITYNFIANDIESVFAYPSTAPYKSIAGSFTLEGNNLIALDLTIGSHVYSLSEVAYAGTTDLFEIGGTINGISTLWSGTDDFMLNAQLRPESLPNSSLSFIYTLAGTSDIFQIKPGMRGTVAIAASTVPVPSAAFLFGSSILGFSTVLKRRR